MAADLQRGLRIRVLLAAILPGILIALALLALSSSDSGASHNPGNPQFSPSFDIRLCNALPATFNTGPAYLNGTGPTCAQNGTASGNPDISSVFSIPIGHHAYAQEYLVFSLKGFTLANHSLIPNGTVIGGLNTTVTLGTLANKCANTVFPRFVFYKSTVDNSAGNVIVVQPEGTPDRFSTLVDDNDTIPNIGDGDSPFVTKYPDISNRFFDPDGSGDATGGYSPVQPAARYVGAARIPPGPAGEWGIAQLFVFAPGALQTAFSSNPATLTHPFAKLTSGLGYTTVVTAQDPTATKISTNPISDFCTPLSNESALLGRVDTNGDTTLDTPRVVAPASAGSYYAQYLTFSVRDKDSDGLENDIDTCPNVANVEDPYVSAGPDTPLPDMLDSACDPTPATNTNFSDHDGDGYLNPQDNCPLIANNPNQDLERSTARNVSAPDGGPRSDEIGDACDAAPTVSDGGYFNAIYVDSVCIAGTDNDDDGWCAPNDLNDNAANDKGGTFSRRLPDATDPDGDGKSSNAEWAVGTDPLNPCPLLPGHDAWMPDLDTNKTVNILDIVQLTPPAFNASAGNPNYKLRLDLDANGTINILDIVQLTPPVFNTSC